jgi:hypothetical protein
MFSYTKNEIGNRALVKLAGTKWSSVGDDNSWIIAVD